MARTRFMGAGEHEPVLRFDRREIGEQPLLIVVADEYVGVGRPGPGLLGGRSGHVMVLRRVLILFLLLVRCLHLGGESRRQKAN